MPNHILFDIKMYRENQNLVLNTIFTQNPQYINFVLKKITNSIDTSLLLGQNRFILLLQRLLNLPYIFQYGPGVFNVASQLWIRDPITSIASLGSGPGTQLKYIGKTKMYLNTIFALNPQYIYFVLKKITKS